MPMLGDVLIDVIETEDLTETTDTTDHALEDNETIVDHIENKPITLNITGMIIDPTEQKLLKLRKYRRDGKLLNYRYRSRLETVLITSFTPSKSAKTADGYTFSMTLKQIGLVDAPDVIRVSAAVKKQVKPVTKAGKKSVKKKTAKTTQKKVVSSKKTSGRRR